MKKKIISLIVGLALVSGCTRVEPGYVGIKVNQWGSQKGVNDFPLVTGMVFYNPITEDIYKFPTFMQNAVWTREITRESPMDDSITFNSVEGAAMNADIALAYTFAAEKVPQIFVEFRQPPGVITHGFMKNEINNAFNRVASTMKSSEIFGERKQEMLNNVRSNLNAHLGPKGFRFELISFHGGIRVDNSVRERINAVLAASQRAIENNIEAEAKVVQAKAGAEQLIQKARGEKESKIAQAEGEARSITLKAEAQANANKLLSESMTPALIQYETIQKWDGRLSVYNGAGGVPIISLGSTNLVK